MTTLSTRHPSELAAAHKAGDRPLIIDVRTPAEFEAIHIRGSYNVPLDLLGEHASDLAARVHPDTVLVCASGVRAEQARQRLAAEGVSDACILDGGVGAFDKAGGEVVRGRAAWAMERQVRLAAGALVLTGLTAGRFAHPRARALSGAIGAGLTFSALSDTCAMGRALAVLPWNRGARDLGGAEAVNAIPRHGH